MQRGGLDPYQREPWLGSGVVWKYSLWWSMGLLVLARKTESSFSLFAHLINLMCHHQRTTFFWVGTSKCNPLPCFLYMIKCWQLCSHRLGLSHKSIFFLPSVQPLSAGNICWQWRYCGFCSPSTGESGHSSAQHTTLGGRARRRLSNDITQPKVPPLRGTCFGTAHSLCIFLSTQINGAEKPVCRELHIAYRYGDHYDSVRRTGDNSESPAQLRIEVSIQKVYERTITWKNPAL